MLQSTEELFLLPCSTRKTVRFMHSTEKVAVILFTKCGNVQIFSVVCTVEW